jgi:diguanylate cyclase (GGDEF)-like protein/PAS domain S-box-containing protein
VDPEQLAVERLRAFLERSPVGMCEVDFAGRILSANPALARMLDYTPAELMAVNSLQLNHPDARATRDEIRDLVAATGHWTGERVVVRRDGSALPVLMAVNLVRRPDGRPHHMAATLIDISRWKAAEQELQASEQRLRLSFDGALVGMSLVSLEAGSLGRLLQVNAALCDFLGFAEPELLELSFTDLAHPDDVAETRSAIAALSRGELTAWRAEKRLLHAGGEQRWALISSAAVPDHDGRPQYAVNQIEDITARKEAEDRLVHQTLHDGLTGLASRPLLHDHLQHALARADRVGTRIAVLFLDLDNFKTVNDSLGHAAGDAILVEAAHRLTQTLRGADLAARIGGDEFVVVCEDVHIADDITLLAQRLLEVLTRETVVSGHPVPMSASIGIALSSRESTPEELLRDADAAMYRAKNRGKARWEIADEAMHAAAARLLEVETGLHEALAQGRLELHNQPTVDLYTGALMGVEALLRWRHPTRGLLLPREFLDVAEDRRMMVPIGEWVLQRAWEQAAEWYRRYGARAPTVAINVSSEQVGRYALLAQARSLVEDGALPADRLCMEITERQVIDLTGSAAAELHGLAELGIRLAVDDFGTGYAGFDYLRRLPVHVLKIDRSFVAGLGRDRTDTAITHSIVALGEALDLTVVAEGVEAADQHDLLRELGCPQGQGWWWHAAMPARELDALLAEANAFGV